MEIEAMPPKNDAAETADLIARVKNGDNEAFELLLSVYRPLVLKYTAKYADALGEDVAYQEACVALHKAAVGYRESGEVTFGLFATICINRALDVLTKAQKSEEIPIGDREFSVQNGIEQRLVSAEWLQRIRVIARELLSDYEYEVFELDIHGYKTAAIVRHFAEKGKTVTAKSVDNAKTRLYGRLRQNVGRFPKD